MKNSTATASRRLLQARSNPFRVLVYLLYSPDVELLDDQGTIRVDLQQAGLALGISKKSVVNSLGSLVHLEWVTPIRRCKHVWTLHIVKPRVIPGGDGSVFRYGEGYTVAVRAILEESNGNQTQAVDG